ncbi:MAG TPA: TrmH family RNA methyltransferase, partial [Chiayiivirga sp.]|nr:TrmH family RNA methyltransferase [Chiayiivirga sp.]
MPSDTAFPLIRIVLVGTSHPGNIGAAARAMRTMGLSRLDLVAPERFPHREADAMAAGADDVLAGARVFDSLAEAIDDC